MICENSVSCDQRISWTYIIGGSTVNVCENNAL